MELSRETDIHIIGIAWKDEANTTKEWLDKHGNPYTQVMPDPAGTLTTILGITGVPETYLVDKNGMVVYKYSAPLTRHELDNTLMPLIRKLRHEK